jgi:hypothetical protein
VYLIVDIFWIVENGGSVSDGSKWLEEKGDCLSDGGLWMCSGEQRQCVGRQ